MTVNEEKAQLTFRRLQEELRYERSSIKRDCFAQCFCKLCVCVRCVCACAFACMHLFYSLFVGRYKIEESNGEMPP